MNSYDRIVQIVRRGEMGDEIDVVLTESGRVFYRFFNSVDDPGWSESTSYPPGCDPNPHVEFE